MNEYDHPPNVTAHFLIAQVAEDMANDIWETLCMGSNAIYKVNSDRKHFVQHCAPTLKAAAKAVLGQMLADPNVTDREKQDIFEALTLDNQLPKGGTSMVRKPKKQFFTKTLH